MGNSSPSEGISIVGIGLNLPGGIKDPEAFWQALLDQQVIVEPAPDRGNGEHTRIRPGAFLDDLPRFDRHFFGLSRPLAASLDPRQRLLLECSWNALEDAGIVPGSLAGSRTGVFVGSLNFGEFQGSKSEGRQTASAYGYTGGYSSFLAQRLSYSYDLRGPSLAIDTACSGGLTALHLALQSLRLGECELALVGAVNLIHLTLDEILAAMGVLSKTHRCSPFGAAADGYVRGEACVVLVLSRRPQPGAGSVYAILKGSALGQLGRGKGISASGGPAQEMPMREALADASIVPEQVSYLEANSSGNLVGDALEVKALRNVYDVPNRNSPLHLGAVRANFGHTEGASGLLSVAKALLCFRHGFLPPQPAFTELNPESGMEGSRLSLLLKGRPWQGERFAGIHNYGQGGSTAHVILASPQVELAASGPSRREYLLLVSAACQAGLAHRLEGYRQRASRLSDLELAALCCSAAQVLTDMDYRLALCAEDAPSLRTLLAQPPPPLSPQRTKTCPTLVFAEEAEQVLQAFAGYGIAPETRLQNGSEDATPVNDELTVWVQPAQPPVGGQLLEPDSRLSWLQCLSSLWSRGVTVNWSRVMERQPWLAPPAYPFQGESLPVSEPALPGSDSAVIATPGERVDWFALVQQAVQRHLKAAISPAEWNRNFSELGLDSVALLSVIDFLQKSTPARLSPSLVYQYPTAPALAKFLQSLESAEPAHLRQTNTRYPLRAGLTLVLFLLALWLPFLDHLFVLDRVTPSLRPLEDGPFPWNLDLRLDQNRKQLEEWMQATLGFRSLLVRSNGRVLTLGLRSSSSPQVLLGSNGFLFDPEMTIWALRPQQSPGIQELLKANRRFLKARGIHYLTIRSAFKEEVYPQFLPPGFRYPYPGPAQRAEFKGPDPDNLDLLPSVLAAQTRGVFERTGIHWNGLGGWAAYQDVAARLSQWYPDIHPLKESEVVVRYNQEWGADEARKLGVEDYLLEMNPSVLPKHPLYQLGDSRVQNDHFRWMPPMATEIPGSQLPTAVVFQDSMMECMQPLLSQHFRRIVYLQAGRPSVVNAQVLAAERPDVVIHMNPYSSIPEQQPPLEPSLWEGNAPAKGVDGTTEVVAQVDCSQPSVVALRDSGGRSLRRLPRGLSWVHFHSEKSLQPGRAHLQWLEGSGKILSYREAAVSNPLGLKTLFESSREVVVDNPLTSALELQRGTFKLNLTQKAPSLTRVGPRWNLEERQISVDCPIPAPGRVNVWKVTWKCNGPLRAYFSVPVNGNWAPQDQLLAEGENVAYFRHPFQSGPQTPMALLMIHAKKCKVRVQLKSVEIRSVPADQAPYITLSVPGQSARL